MSSIGYAQGRRAREAAAKERRKKLLAFGGLGLLAVVLVIQVPKTLDMLRGENNGVTGSSGLTTPSAPHAPTGRGSGRVLRILRTAKADDPFASRRVVDGETRPGSVGAPAGLHDPFQQPSAATASAAAPAPRIPRRIIVGTPGTRAPRIGYTVVLASIPTSNSRASAVRFARTARARGVHGVGVLRSSARNRLRAGYWVVYSGMYRNAAGAQRAAGQVHARGYRTAYLRQLVRY
jgi:septal ring-binding cell division protein DamX